MSRRPRVVHLINGEYFGGSARVLVNYLASSERRAEVTVGVFFAGELERHLGELGVPSELIGMRGRFDLPAARQVAHLVREWRADVIHTHQVRNSLVGRLASRLTGVPVVTHVHSPAFRESTNAAWNLVSGAADKLFAGRTRRYIAVSRSLAAELRRLGVAQERIRVVPNGVPLPPPADDESRLAVRREFGVADDEAVIGMVANFRPRKGAETLLNAAARLAGERSFRLLMIGEAFRHARASYADELTSLARKLDISDRVRFTGYRPDAQALIRGLDVFVLPSLFGEGLPMVLLEAMGSQVAVVTTPVEGNAELVDDGANGLLVAPADDGALATAIAGLLDDPELRARLAAAGRQTVAQGYTADAMTRGIEAVYDELLA